MKKGAIRSKFERFAPVTSHYPKLGNITELSQRTTRSISDYHMIEDIDFKELARPDKVAGHFDVSFRRFRLSRRMIVQKHNCRRCPYHGAPEYTSCLNE